MTTDYWASLESYWGQGQAGAAAGGSAGGPAGSEFDAGGAASAFAAGAGAGAAGGGGLVGGLVGGMAGLLSYSQSHPGVGVLGESQAPGAVVDPIDPALLWKSSRSSTLNGHPLDLRAAIGPAVDSRRPIDGGAGGLGLYVEAVGAFRAGGAQCSVRILPVDDDAAYGGMVTNWLNQAGIFPEDFPPTDSIYLALLQTPRPPFATGTPDFVNVRDAENITGRRPVVVWAWADSAAGTDAEPAAAIAAQYPVEVRPADGSSFPSSSSKGAGAGAILGGGVGLAVLGVVLSKVL